MLFLFYSSKYELYFLLFREKRTRTASNKVCHSHVEQKRGLYERKMPVR